MASIKQLDDRRFKITVSNGYRPDGKKICKAKTIRVPESIPKRGIPQYVAHEAEELERQFKTGYSEDGNLLTIDRLSRGRVFGETLVCSMSQDSPIQIDALNDTEVLYLDFDPLLLQQENGCPYRMRVTANLLQEMGRGALFLNQKMRILAQNRLRNRIKVYLQGLPVASNGEIRLEMGRGEMADYLCVDRSALSRELGRMQKEGILTYQGQVIQILDSKFLTA